MKNITVFIFLFIVSAPLFGQFEWVDDQYEDLVPVKAIRTKHNQYVVLLKDANWWAVQKMVVIDSTGDLIFDYVPDPFGPDLTSIHDIIVNPDSTFSITTSNAAGMNGYYILFGQVTKFDKNFNIVPVTYNHTPFYESFGAALNGGGYIFYERDWGDGIGRRDEQGLNIWTKYSYPYGLRDLAITSEDTLVFASGQGLVIMEKEAGDVAHVLPNFQFEKVKVNGWDGIIGQSNDTLFLLSPSYDLLSVSAFPIEGIKGFDVYGNKVAVLTDNAHVYILNDSLVLQHSFPITDESLFQFVMAGAEKIALAGLETYGPDMPTGGNTGAFVKDYSCEGDNYGWSNDVGVVEIIPGPAHVIYLGNQYEVKYEYVQVKVMNHGANPVDRLNLNHRIQNPAQSSRKFFSAVGLMPGEDTTLVWEGFSFKTFAAPTGFQKVCIWTSHPDFRLDANSTNDGLCMDFLVSDQEPNPDFSFIIYPNPSSTGSTVAYGLPPGNGAHIRVFNSVGMLMESHQVASGEGSISLAKYLVGLYYVSLEMDGQPVKVLKFVQM